MLNESIVITTTTTKNRRGRMNSTSITDDESTTSSNNTTRSSAAAAGGGSVTTPTQQPIPTSSHNTTIVSNNNSNNTIERAIRSSSITSTKSAKSTNSIRPEQQHNNSTKKNDEFVDIPDTVSIDGINDEENPISNNKIIDSSNNNNSSTLEQLPSNIDSTTNDSPDNNNTGKEEFTSIWIELRRFARISAPNTLTMLLMNLQSSITLSVAARHLGTEEMTGVSLANLTANLSCLTIVYGLLSAVDTLAPQAFGAGNLIEVGILVQRGLVTIFATFIVTLFLWFNAESFLLWVGQPPDESRLAGVFLRYFFLAIPGLTIWESGRRFMWAQEVTQWPFVAIAAAALLVHVTAVHVCIPALGFPGAPIAHVLTNWSLAIFFGIWVKWKSPHNPKTWIVSRERVMDHDAMKAFLKLGLAGIGTMTEWIFFEAFVFISGELGETALAANSILYTLIPMCYTVPSGLSIATTTRVGALLAQGKVRGAKQLTRNVAIVTICLGCTSAIVIWLLREPLIYTFAVDPNVQDLARSIWPRLCLFLLLDALFGVQCGLLRALGMQVIYAGIVFVCLFVIGLPIIASLAFPWGSKMGLAGMWIGMPIAYVVLNLCLLCASFWRNWKKYSDAVVERERLIRISLEGFVPT
jgi:MATE family multidrug resistance protein